MAVFAAIGLALSFALMGVWVRMMDDSFGTFQQVYLRILLAGILALFVFRRKFGAGLLGSITGREWAVYGARGFAMYTVGVVGFTVGAQHTSLGTVSFIAALPILGPLAWIVFREKVAVKSWLPIGLSVIGLAYLTGVDFRHFSPGIGEWGAIACMLGFDIGYLMTRLHDVRRNNFENTTILLLISWIPIFGLSLIRHETLVPHSVSAIAALGLILSVVGNVVGLYAINYIFTNLKAYVAGNILLLEGVFSLILGLLFYKETVVAGMVIGGLLIVASAIMINTMDKTNEETPDPLVAERT